MRLILIDARDAVRYGLEMRLALEADLTVVGSVRDGRAAKEVAASTCPDVIVMDAHALGVDLISSLEELSRCGQGARVVILSLQDDAETRGRARAAGAFAFVSKQEGFDVLLASIRQAASAPNGEGRLQLSGQLGY